MPMTRNISRTLLRVSPFKLKRLIKSTMTNVAVYSFASRYPQACHGKFPTWSLWLGQARESENLKLHQNSQQKPEEQRIGLSELEWNQVPKRIEPLSRRLHIQVVTKATTVADVSTGIQPGPFLWFRGRQPPVNSKKNLTEYNYAKMASHRT